MVFVVEEGEGEEGGGGKLVGGGSQGEERRGRGGRDDAGVRDLDAKGVNSITIHGAIAKLTHLGTKVTHLPVKAKLEFLQVLLESVVRGI